MTKTALRYVLGLCVIGLLSDSSQAAPFIVGGASISPGQDTAFNLSGSIFTSATDADAYRIVGTRFPAVTFSHLRASVYFFGGSVSGRNVTIAMRLNGVDSSLKCIATNVRAAATCSSPATITVPSNTRVDMRLLLNDTGAPPTASVTWSLQAEQIKASP